LELDEAAARAQFDAIDSNDGGLVLFDEFAAWLARERCPVNGEVMSEYTTTEERPTNDVRTTAAKEVPAAGEAPVGEVP
jgi:hypothetical protein